MAQHLNFIDLLVDMIVTAEPYLKVDLSFKLSKPYLGRTVNVRLEQLIEFCLSSFTLKKYLTNRGEGVIM